MMLKPQDILILMKLVSLAGETDWSYSSLAVELFMSPSEVHSGLKRSVTSGLMDEHLRRPIKKALEELLVHGIRYVYPPHRGQLTRGMPTSYAGPPLKDLLVISPDEPPPVWPDPEGKVQGYEFTPLYKSVPKAASKDYSLYELLVLIDAIRDSRARQRELAIKEIRTRMSLK